MTGTVWKRPDGKWAYRASLGKKPDGTILRRQRNGFATKREAAEALAAVRTEAGKGGVVATSSQTVGAYLESWLASVESSVRPTTHDQYVTVLRAWVLPRIGSKRLADLRPVDVQNLYTGLSLGGKQDGTGLGASSVNTCHRILRQALDQAVAWQLLAVNPASNKLNRPKGAKVAAAHWSPDQAKEFLDATRGHRLYPCFVLMLTSGVRRGEAVGLRWQDVDLDRRQITVVHTRVVSGGRVISSTPKTDAGIRVVELGASTTAALEKHQANAPRLDGYVFLSPRGAPLHPDTLRHAVDAAARKAGLPPLTPKGFRHTAATCALASGVHVKKVQEMLGHSNIQITLDTYSHVIPGQHRDAADAIDAALFPEEEA